MTYQAILRRETAHLPQRDLDLIAQRLVVAIELAVHFPTATEQALTDKLQSFGDCPRWVCVLVARAAQEVAPSRPTSRHVDPATGYRRDDASPEASRAHVAAAIRVLRAA